MDFIEEFRIRQERAKAGLGAEVDRSSVVFDAWKVLRIGIVEDTPAERDESLRARSGVFSRFAFGGRGHAVILLLQCKPQMSQYAGSLGFGWYLPVLHWRIRPVIRAL